MRTINLIVIHCAATQNGDPYFTGTLGEAGFRTPIERIDDMHRARGFRRSDGVRARFNRALSSVGYHYVIYLSGAIAPGRHDMEIPAQAAGFNSHAIGICLLGTDRYAHAQWDSLAVLTRKLADKYAVPLRAPKHVQRGGKRQVRGGICGHRDLSPDQNANGEIEPFEWLKTCPGFEVTSWLKNDLQPDKQHVLKS